MKGDDTSKGKTFIPVTLLVMLVKCSFESLTAHNIIQLTNRLYFQESSMNGHSMFVRRSTKVNASVAVFSAVNVKTAIFHCTASLGEW